MSASPKGWERLKFTFRWVRIIFQDEVAECKFVGMIAPTIHEVGSFLHVGMS
jgi:hypothetical protein